MDPNPREVRDQTVHDAKSALILDAALKVFSEKGYHDARLEDIAATAGFSKASLYNYYEDKEMIFLNIVIRLHNKITEVLRNEIRKDCHITENLTAVLRIVFGFFSENLAFSMGMTDFKTMTPISIEKFQHHQELVAQLKQCLRQMTDLMLSIFTIARDRNEISTTLDNKVLGKYIFSLVRGAFMDVKATGRVADAEKHIQNIVEFLSTGVGFKNSLQH